MKKTIRLSLIAASVLALTACNQEAKKEQAEVKLDTVEQQQAYGIGASVGNFLNKDLADKTEIGIKQFEKLEDLGSSQNDKEVHILGHLVHIIDNGPLLF